MSVHGMYLFMEYIHEFIHSCGERKMALLATYPDLTVRWVLSDIVLSDYTFVRPNVDRHYWLSDKNQGANVDRQGFISTYKKILTDGY